MLMAIILYFLHTLRRLYECAFVSIFSDKSKISIIQYLWGLGYYTLVPMTLLAETNKFPHFDLEMPSVMSTIGFFIFFSGWSMEHSTMKVLARLRRHGGVKLDSHGIPEGRLFDYVSCPHYLGEVLIYIGLRLVLGKSCLSWRILLIYNLVTHMILAMGSHHWYKANYAAYPSGRRALIPFVL